MNGRLNLKAFSKEEVFEFIKARGLPRYRAQQLLHWIYQRQADDIQKITEFPQSLRQDLGKAAYISSLEIAERRTSKDGTEKFLFRLEDGESIESVLIPEEDRLTLCVSSQAGCAMGCRFCLTGSQGLIRNLRDFEIVDQVLSLNRLLGPDRRVTNIVLMGMGEPLANLQEVADALWKMTDILGISKRRITLSTSGLVPRMAELPRVAPEVNLAVSLNATTDRVRDQIMPINKKYPIRALLEACRRYPLKPGRRITFEYVMIRDLNDSVADARRLAGLVKGIRCKINLIPLNPHASSGFDRPTDDRVRAFQGVLTAGKLAAIIRESRGQDILAACGQLKAAGK